MNQDDSRYFVYSDKWFVKKKIFENCFKIFKYFFNRWFWSKLSYFIKKDAKKKDLVWAMHKRREPQRHLLVKNGTWKFCREVLRISQEFPEKYSWEILRNFLRKIPEKFSGISRNLFSYLIPEKSVNLVTKF